MLPSSRSRLALALVAMTSALPACGAVEVEVVPEKPAPPVHALPPAPGPEKAPTHDQRAVFAIRALHLGDADRDGSPNAAHGWKQYGYDLDGKISTKDATDLCQPRNGEAPKNVYPDGEDGIDNSFGRKLLGLIKAAWSDVALKANEGIAAGRSTVLLEITGLGPDEDYNPLAARAYEGAPLGGPALFDGSDVWPVRPESLADPGDIQSSVAHDWGSYVVGDTWVAHLNGTLTLTLVPTGAKDEEVALRLPIHDPWIAMDLDGSRQSATNGTLAGVIAVEDIRRVAAEIYAHFDGSCPPENVAELLAQVDEAADILLDGSQDPGKACDGVSIGVGFEAARVLLGPVGEPVSASPSCL